MGFDPSSFDVGKLFRDPDMFDSASDWEDAGFEILRASDNKICVARHHDVSGYLFKKYVRSGKRDDLDDQLENYETRLEGSRRLRDFIADRNLRNIVVPRKWLRELPREFSPRDERSHVLVVERINFVDESEVKYRDIDEDVLRDLCVVLHEFRGLDSTAKNVPFTKDGKIAFIDTEHWDRHSGKSKLKRPFLKYLGEHLSPDRRAYAKKMWKRLEGEDDDFEDEEDTSSSW